MTGIRHVGIVVRDMDAALHFYRDLLGLRDAPITAEAGPFLDGLLGMEDARVRTVKLAGRDGPARLELLAFDSPPPQPATPLNAVGPTHVALTVSGLDDLYRTLKDAGVPFNAPPRLSPDGGAKVVFCRDPDGTYVELVEPQEDPTP